MTSTQLRTGIPRIDELDQLKRTETYRSPSDYNTAFLARQHDALKGYGKHWGNDPFKLWSRRWEYPFVAQRVLDFAQRPENIGRKLTIMDAGSGVTFFPYYICSRVPSAQFVCVDYDPTYTPMFDAINRAESAQVRFVQASLQQLPLADGELDAVACISVLEHTDNYGQIIDEFLRVLRPGGLFVLTFDVSLDGKFTLPIPQAQELLGTVQAKFAVDEGVNFLSELSHAHDAGVLTSDHVRKTEPDLLPWTFPVRIYKAAHDLMTGKGWTAGFRSRTVFCCSVSKPAT